jgi:phage gp29-like protein
MSVTDKLGDRVGKRVALQVKKSMRQEFAETKKTEKPQVGEVKAARGEDLFSYFNDRAVNPNDFFEKEKNRTMIEQVRAMNEADPHLCGMMQTRKLAVLGFKRQVMGEGTEADFVREVLARIQNFDMIMMQILDAIPCGFSVAEIIWNYLDGKVVIDDLKPRCQDKFTFDIDWNLRLITQGNPLGDPMPEKKFVVFSYASEYGNRFGSALYQNIYWSWYIKKNVVKFWSIFCEKHGSPTVIGRVPKVGSTPASNAALLAFVKDLKNHQGISLPEGYEIDLLEAQRGSSITTFESFSTWLANAMAIVILGQAGTIESGDNGSNARVTGLDRVRQDILRADISFLETVINDTLIKWLVDYNFANVKEYPKWRIVYEQKPDIQMLAEVTRILVEAGDDQIPLSWMHQQVGIPELAEGEKAFSRVPAPTFGMPPASDVPTFAEIQFKRDQENWQKEIKK